MKTGDIVKLLGVSDTTIRRWIKEFEPLFSDHARQADSKHRSFTASDYLILATVKTLSHDNLPLAEIRKRLNEGYRVEDTSAATAGYEDGRMVPAAAVEQIIDASAIRAELDSTRMQLEYIRGELEKRDQQLVDRDTRIQELMQKNADLERQLGKAEGRLEEIERQRNKRK